MLLDLFLLNVFIMLCSWVLVTYNRRAEQGWSMSLGVSVLPLM